MEEDKFEAGLEAYDLSSVLTHELKLKDFSDGVLSFEGVRVGLAVKDVIVNSRRSIKELTTGVMYTGLKLRDKQPDSKVTLNALKRVKLGHLNYMPNFPGQDMFIEVEKSLVRGIEFGRAYGNIGFYYSSREMLSNALGTYGFYGLSEPFSWREVGEGDYGLMFPRKGSVRPRKLMWTAVPGEEISKQLTQNRDKLLRELRRFLGN